MTKNEVIQRIRDIGIVPVVRATSADEAMRAIDAIREGGISVLEITMTVPGAIGVIEQCAKAYGKDALIGAGTVLDAETARAIDELFAARAELLYAGAGHGGETTFAHEDRSRWLRALERFEKAHAHR